LPQPLLEQLQISFTHHPALNDQTFAHGLENKPWKIWFIRKVCT
jgi:hypothetical protein